MRGHFALLAFLLPALGAAVPLQASATRGGPPVTTTSMPADRALQGSRAQAPGSQAQEAPRLRSDVDTTVVTVGDPITLQVTVDHAPDGRVAWPDSLDLGPFEVLAARTSGPRGQGQRSQSSLTLSLAAYELGELEIPAFDVAVVGPEGDSTLLGTNPFVIRVESVGLDEGGDIRELKGPLGIPMNPARLALWVLGILFLAVLAVAVYRRIRSTGEPHQAPAPEAPERPAHEVALEALARLEASPLLDRGEVKEYHIQVSDILRTYVEGRFRVPALEMTTRDIVTGLGQVGVKVPIRDDFRDFLDRCDLVKFAKLRPDVEASRGILALGRRLVEETVPEEEAP